jgi:hypothetical protein
MSTTLVRGGGGGPRRWWQRLAPLRTAALAGALLAFTLAAASDGQAPSLVRGLWAAPFGALFGIAVRGLLRLFPVAPAAFPAAGLLSALALASLLDHGDAEGPGGTLLVAAIFGLLLGWLEWGSEARALRLSSSAPPGPDDPSATI